MVKKKNIKKGNSMNEYKLMRMNGWIWFFHLFLFYCTHNPGNSSLLRLLLGGDLEMVAHTKWWGN
ncbi:hypothetical protein BDV26DRAFT_174478 [Aspergillus bertholletiae]|uniref:Uncharacterized protein n=1 Tax=Aspergillus bertholletiae TaxID=1226010 RepID=A0A5N7BBG2_9EURO|nr:hypothetical protein BDV26DRAFT_174478 [Aspergillus bertholletiae]